MNTKHEGLERECRCKVTIDGQETCCSFSVPSETPLDQAVLAAHRQEAHGLVIAPKDSYLWGADDEIFLVGIAEIQARCTARLPAAGDTLRTTEYPITSKYCATRAVTPSLATRSQTRQPALSPRQQPLQRCVWPEK